MFWQSMRLGAAPRPPDTSLPVQNRVMQHARHREAGLSTDGAPLYAGSLTKLLLRLRKLQGQVPYKLTAEAMLFLAAILRLGESAQMAHPIDADSQDRIITCLEVLSHSHLCSSRTNPAPQFNAYLLLLFSLASCCLWQPS